MKILVKKFAVIFAITLIVMNAMVITTFANINKKNLYSIGDCGKLLKKGDVIVKTSIVVYNKDGKEYPAYCLDKSKAGVDEKNSYSVDLNGIIKNVYVWKAITNGYPYKTPKQMGCNTVGEAFMATKMAVYAVLYSYSSNDFSPIGEAGERTWNALNNILNKVNDGNNTQISSKINIIEEKNEWENDSKQKKYITKTFQVKTEAPISTYKIDLEDKTEGTILTDENNNLKSEFSSKEKFKVAIPISELSSGGKIKIHASSNVETKPIFIGKAENTSNQDYAITGITYEDGSGDKEVYYSENRTKLKIIKKDETGNKRLEGAIFQLLDENKKILISEIKTDKNGEAILNNVMPGKYYIKEINSPEGYILYDGYIEVNPKINEELTITIKNSKKSNPEITQNKSNLEVEKIQDTIKKLPKTGM